MTAAIWMHRGAIGAGAGALVLVALTLWTLQTLRELSHLRERMSRLADGLALLTDTTEAGLSTVLREIEAIGRRRPAPRASRAAVSRRVVAAAKNGARMDDIAGIESLSESEVRLHLKLAEGQARS
jgi:hypothetical protein